MADRVERLTNLLAVLLERHLYQIKWDLVELLKSLVVQFATFLFLQELSHLDQNIQERSHI
ncbi:MAG: hypothetical protein GKR86_13630 [Ilumatobacter sp.]|nr:hypothetical protein [Ilumatobacter sp.]